MKKNLFTIEDSERQRILEMHINATQKLYINEQTTGDTKTYCSKYGNLIPGMVWSECKDDSKGKSVTQISQENENFFKTYYKGDLNGKTAAFFNKKGDEAPYLITNINDFFKIESFKKSEKEVNDFYILSVAANTEKPYTYKYARVLGKGNVRLFKSGSNAGYTQVESPIWYFSV